MKTYKPGALIEDYRVLSELGRGAASIIYLVQDPKNKQVSALKHVHRDNPKDQRFLDQAESEYEIANKLRHPNIRRIDRMIRKKKQFLTVKDLYLVMELVDGMSLDTIPPQTFEDGVNVFHQVAEAMAHMHDKGFVHADMKPNNIVVNEHSEAKIIDLGQSCKIGTIKPRIQGTPDYIAPEQVHRRAITPKTDIYNLGATMYWVLTKKHVPTALAQGDSLLGSKDDNLIERPTPAIELNSRIPEKLSELIMQCVEVNPDERPLSMHLVADKLNLIESILRAQSEKVTVEDDETAA